MAKKQEAAAENTAKTEAPASETESTAPVKALPLKKITIKDVCGDVKKWYTDNEHKGLELAKQFEAGKLTQIPVARIYGRVIKTRPGSGNHGEFVRFDGRFFGVDLLGVNNAAGTLFSAGTCLLPKWLEKQIDAAYSENGEAVMFGFDIFLKAAPSASLRYEYVAETLIDAQDDMSVTVNTFPAIPTREVLALPAA